MKIKSILTLLTASFIFTFSSVFSQAEFPENGPVFRDNMVPRVDIIINPDTLDWIYENVDSNTEFRAKFIFKTDTLEETLENVGFRLRGNTSRNAHKKSFKLSFNTFETGRKFYGLEKLNLNGEHNDPSIIRSKVSCDLMRSFGIPTPRTSHVQVYINGNYYGLYIQVEHIDEEFVESRFGNKNGNLFKCSWLADLDDKGDNPDNYKHMQNDRRVYDLKTNTQADDYTDIAHFINILNDVPSDVFPCEIEDVFNVYDYLRVIALDVFLGNWDGPIYNKNNFYLYHNTSSNKMEYIPYDLDNTLGIDWMGKDWGTRNIYDWNKHGEPRPIYTKMMGSEELKEIYSQYMSELIHDTVTGSRLSTRILELKEMIAPYVQNDPYYPLDYGFSFQDFNDSYQNSLGGHVDYGLLPYIETRRNSAQEQLEVFQYQAIINHIRYKTKSDGSELRIRAYVREKADSVLIVYTENGGAEKTISMYDDGEHHDKKAGDGIYANSFENIEIDTKILYQIRTVINTSINRVSPCNPIEYHYHESELPALFINEFMADNSSYNSDGYGDFGDWIEVYNDESHDVYLGDKYLSDNIDDPNKWQMPNINLAPGGFALFWADGETGKGPMHTNFKLKSGGEEIGIFDSESTGYFPLDTLHYGSQLINISQGRYPDAGDTWQLFTIPSPGSSNHLDGVNEESNNRRLQIFPNPSSIEKIYFNRIVDVKLYNLSGVLFTNAHQINELDLEGISAGVYLLKDEEGNTYKIVIQ